MILEQELFFRKIAQREVPTESRTRMCRGVALCSRAASAVADLGAVLLEEDERGAARDLVLVREDGLVPRHRARACARQSRRERQPTRGWKAKPGRQPNIQLPPESFSQKQKRATQGLCYCAVHTTSAPDVPDKAFNLGFSQSPWRPI